MSEGTSQASLVNAGVDISKPMIDHAREKYLEERRLSFLLLDIEASALPSKELARYNNALSFYCLHWCQNSRYTFRLSGFLRLREI